MTACSERYGERSPEHVPKRVPVTRGYMLLVSVFLLGFIGGFLAWAGVAATDGDAWEVAKALAFASPFVFALAHGWIRWRRGTMGRGTTFRGPGNGE
jgi:hypothetical protein